MRSLYPSLVIPISFSVLCHAPAISVAFTTSPSNEGGLPKFRAMRTQSLPHSIHHVRRLSAGFPQISGHREHLTPALTVGLAASIPSNDANNIHQDEPASTKNAMAEIVAVASWMAALSSFLLLNNFHGPWPTGMEEWFPLSIWMFLHATSGMLFSGGIILTTLIEWLVVGAASSKTKNGDALPILQFWFDEVPTLDMAVVLPALTLAIFSGTGLASYNYGNLGDAPLHIKASLHALVTFAIWWGATDLTTQGPARDQLLSLQKEKEGNEIMPNVLVLRRISNVVSCTFVLVLYGIMIIKPGF